jgi:hypothetical protein
MMRPSSEMMRTISTLRNNLEDTFFKLQLPLPEPHTEIWNDFIARIGEILRRERQYLRISSRLVQPLEVNLLDRIISDIRNQAPFVTVEERLAKAKYFTNLLFEADASQMTPQYGQNPLHVAATFDIAMPLIREDAPRSDFTKFMFEAMGDHAARAISHANSQGENMLHLGIRNHLEGVESFIQAADSAAFWQTRLGDLDEARQGRLPGQGNTALHDALDRDYFLKRVPLCAVGEPGACDTCQKAESNKSSALKEWRGIVQTLLEREPGVLTIQNSAGLPPYVYLRLACGKEDDVEDDEGQEEDEVQSVPPPSQLAAADAKPSAMTIATCQPPSCPHLAPALLLTPEFPINCNGGTLAEKAQTLGIAVSLGAMQNGNGPLTTPRIDLRGPRGAPNSHRAEQLGGRKVRRSATHAEKRPEPPVDQEPDGGMDDASLSADGPVEHTEDQLKEIDVGSTVILGDLRRAAYRLGSYEKTRKALFSRREIASGSVPSGDGGEREIPYNPPRKSSLAIGINTCVRQKSFKSKISSPSTGRSGCRAIRPNVSTSFSSSAEWLGSR